MLETQIASQAGRLSPASFRSGSHARFYVDVRLGLPSGLPFWGSLVPIVGVGGRSRIKLPVRRKTGVSPVLDRAFHWPRLMRPPFCPAGGYGRIVSVRPSLCGILLSVIDGMMVRWTADLCPSAPRRWICAGWCPKPCLTYGPRERGAGSFGIQSTGNGELYTRVAARDVRILAQVLHGA